MLSDVLWADSEFEKFEANYGDVVLHLEESTGVHRVIRCSGYIGFHMPSFWDEVVIESAEVTATHPVIDRCLADLSRRLGQTRTESGNSERNTGSYSALVVEFSDGAQLLVVASKFSTE